MTGFSWWEKEWHPGCRGIAKLTTERGHMASAPAIFVTSNGVFLRLHSHLRIGYGWSVGARLKRDIGTRRSRSSALLWCLGHPWPLTQVPERAHVLPTPLVMGSGNARDCFGRSADSCSYCQDAVFCGTVGPGVGGSRMSAARLNLRDDVDAVLREIVSDQPYGPDSLRDPQIAANLVQDQLPDASGEPKRSEPRDSALTGTGSSPGTRTAMPSSGGRSWSPAGSSLGAVDRRRTVIARFEHADDVRRALRSIVSDPALGPDALNNTQSAANLLHDLLPDAPRETSLPLAAISATAPAVLREHVAQGMSSDTAIRLAAAALASQTAFPAPLRRERAACGI